MNKQLTIEQLIGLLERLKPEDSFLHGIKACMPDIGSPHNVSLLLTDDGGSSTVYEVFQILNSALGATLRDRNLMERLITKDCMVYLSYEGCYGKMITGIEMNTLGLSFKTEYD